MTGVWRNRGRAPAYALVISLALGLALGAYLHDPMTITFMSKQNNQSTNLQNLPVLVKTTDGKQLIKEELDDSQAITMVNPQKKIEICLREDWIIGGGPVKDTKEGEPDGWSCSLPRDPDKNVSITPSKLLRIRFTSETNDQSPEWRELRVLVRTTGSEHLADAQPNGSKEITVVNPRDNITICLPEEWVVDKKEEHFEAATTSDYNELSCWRTTQAEDDEITLTPRGAN
jgi:hypothetical protein